MEGEQERLERLYRELGDEHLLDLADESGDLTPEAEGVLQRELQRRGLKPATAEPEAIVMTEEPERESGFGAGIPGVFPASAAMMEQALEPKQTREGMSSLISFYDGIELSKACGILEEAGMEPSIEAVDGDAQTGVPPRYEVWLETEDVEEAKSLLRDKMGLFPLAEVDGEADVATTGLVGVFQSTADVDQVRELLTEAGIVVTVTPDAETGEYEVSVPPEEQARALDVVANGMGLG